MSTITIAGASGFIGRHLHHALAEDGRNIRTIGRNRDDDAQWGEDLRSVLDGSDAVVNLAGRSVSCRYNKKNADAIFASRTETTRDLGAAMAECTDPPSVWLNASTATIYRDARDRPQNETTGELGSGFSVAVARAWESELFESPAPVRKVALRTAITLGQDGALNPLINLARMGFGGPQGDGHQRFSWIHIDDVLGAIRFLIEESNIAGAVNLSAPHQVTNAELMALVRGRFGRARGVPLPAWSLEFGGRIIQTEAELVLKSRWVQPTRLLEEGYEFVHPDLAGALAAISEHTTRGLLPVQLG